MKATYLVTIFFKVSISAATLATIYPAVKFLTENDGGVETRFAEQTPQVYRGCVT